MNNLDAFRTESDRALSESGAGVCPVHAGPRARQTLNTDDELLFPNHRRAFSHYFTGADGVTQLGVYYGDKEIVFDEHDLFHFGEQLTRQERFRAGSAMSWGEGYEWPRISELLKQLVDEGVLYLATELTDEETPRVGPQSSPLPPAPAHHPRTWFECEAIMFELTGKSLELGYLECVVPIFRVAHMALDAEGRQIGESNVFPGKLRLDIPTNWRSCPHIGSRYEAPQPMNVTALKSMRNHWSQMLAALRQIKDAYLRRFPKARNGWTVGDLQRLTTLVLTLPAYLLLRSEHRVENGQLHPVLSSLFRVTDGIHMTTSIMLYSSDDEPTQMPDAPLSAADIYAYVERNDLFRSNHGVCAGPPAMVEEFLSVLVEGEPSDGNDTVALDQAVQAALDDLDPAFDYCLLGLKTHALAFSLWPLMGHAYEQLLAIVKDRSDVKSEMLDAFEERLQSNLALLLETNGLTVKEWHLRRERVYLDMYTQSANALGAEYSGTSLSECLAVKWSTRHRHAEKRLYALLDRKLQGAGPEAQFEIERLVGALMDYFAREQAVVRSISVIQQQINRLLGRPQALRPLKASDLTLFYELRGGSERQPYLGDDLRECLGLQVTVTADAIEISEQQPATRSAEV